MLLFALTFLSVFPKTLVWLLLWEAGWGQECTGVWGEDQKLQKR